MIHCPRNPSEEGDFYICGGIIHMIVFDIKSDVMHAIYNKPIKLNYYQRDRYVTMIRLRCLRRNSRQRLSKSNMS